jgi:hypothetical protein
MKILGFGEVTHSERIENYERILKSGKVETFPALLITLRASSDVIDRDREVVLADVFPGFIQDIKDGGVLLDSEHSGAWNADFGYFTDAYIEKEWDSELNRNKDCFYAKGVADLRYSLGQDLDTAIKDNKPLGSSIDAVILPGGVVTGITIDGKSVKRAYKKLKLKKISITRRNSNPDADSVISDGETWIEKVLKCVKQEDIKEVESVKITQVSKNTDTQQTEINQFVEELINIPETNPSDRLESAIKFLECAKNEIGLGGKGDFGILKALEILTGKAWEQKSMDTLRDYPTRASIEGHWEGETNMSVGKAFMPTGEKDKDGYPLFRLVPSHQGYPLPYYDKPSTEDVEAACGGAAGSKKKAPIATEGKCPVGVDKCMAFKADGETCKAHNATEKGHCLNFEKGEDEPATNLGLEKAMKIIDAQSKLLKSYSDQLEKVNSKEVGKHIVADQNNTMNTDPLAGIGEPRTTKTAEEIKVDKEGLQKSMDAAIKRGDALTVAKLTRQLNSIK